MGGPRSAGRIARSTVEKQNVFRRGAGRSARPFSRSAGRAGLFSLSPRERPGRADRISSRPVTEVYVTSAARAFLR